MATKRPDAAAAASAAPTPPALYRLTKAQHEKALAAAQTQTVGGAVYQNLANKLGAYQIGNEVDFTEAEIAMLKEWDVSVRDAE